MRSERGDGTGPGLCGRRYGAGFVQGGPGLGGLGAGGIGEGLSAFGSGGDVTPNPVGFGTGVGSGLLGALSPQLGGRAGLPVSLSLLGGSGHLRGRALRR